MWYIRKPNYQENQETLLLAQIGSKLDNELVKRVIRGTTLEGNEAVIKYWHLDDIRHLGQ